MLTGPFPAFLAFGLCASALRVGLPARRAERRQADATLPCTCPLDKFNSTGTLIAWAPQYSCAYPFGICTWLQTGAIESSTSSACPASAACVGFACVCPTDQTGASGTFLNQSTPYTCAYFNGACAYDGTGTLMNAQQPNCYDARPCEMGPPTSPTTNTPLLSPSRRAQAGHARGVPRRPGH